MTDWSTFWICMASVIVACSLIAGSVEIVKTRSSERVEVVKAHRTPAMPPGAKGAQVLDDVEMAPGYEPPSASLVRNAMGSPDPRDGTPEIR